MDTVIRGSEGKCYTFVRFIGHGAFGEVWKATRKDTNEDFAIKKVHSKDCQRETSLHRMLGHLCKSVVRFHEEITAGSVKYLVLEYCPNGNLQMYIDKNGRLSEHKAQHFFKGIVSGVAYLHYKHVVHRDLKPANLLLTSAMNVKIADFGHAIKLNENEKCRGLYGTIPYYSPEMLEDRPYGRETDCWSLGCILYFFLSGRPPFSCSQTGSSIRNVAYSALSMNSHSVNDLIQALLTKDQERRLSAYGILNHPFMKEEKTKHSTHSFDSGMYSDMNSPNLQMTSRTHSFGVSTSGLDGINSSEPTCFRINERSSTGLRSSYGNSPPVRLSPRFMPELKENLLPNMPQVLCRNYNNKREVQLRTLHGRERDVSEERRHMKLIEDKLNQHCQQDEFRKPYTSSPQQMTNHRVDPILREKLLPRKNQKGEQHFNNERGVHQHAQERDIYLKQLEEDRFKYDHCEEFIAKTYDKSPQDGHPQQHSSHSHCDLDVSNNGSSNQLCCKSCHRNLVKGRTCSKENIERNSHVNVSPDNNDNHSCSSNKSDHCCHKSNHSGVVNHKCWKHCTSGKHSNHSCTSACSCSSSCCECHHQLKQNTCLETDIRNGVPDHSSLDYNHKCNILLETNSIIMPGNGVCSDKAYSRQPESHYSSSQETFTSEVQSLPLPLKLTGLKPQRSRVKNIVFSILDSGELCVEVIRNNVRSKSSHHGNFYEEIATVHVISEDGMMIGAYHPKATILPLSESPPSIPPTAFSIFSYNNLPRKYWKAYHLAARFIKYVRSTTRKITLYTEKGNFVLMENDPNADFIGTFNSGEKVNKTGDSVQIIRNGNTFSLTSEEQIYSLGEEVMNLWKYFCRCHEHCRKIEARVERDSEDDIFYHFPLIIGSPRNPIRMVSRQGILPKSCPNSTSISVASTVLTDATNLTGRNHHFGLKKDDAKLQNCHFNTRLADHMGIKSNISKNQPRSNSIQQRGNIPNQHPSQDKQLYKNIKKQDGVMKEVHINKIDKLNNRIEVTFSDNTKLCFRKVKPVDKIYYCINGRWKEYPLNEPKMIKELPPDLRQRIAMLGTENFRDSSVT